MADAQAQAPDIESLDLEGFKAEDFAKLISVASDEQITEVGNGPHRKLILDQIFGRAAEHVEPGKAKGNDAVVHFKILDRPQDQGGGYDHYEIVIKDGTATVSDRPEQEPRVTIKVNPLHFFKLITGKESGPVLFMTGRLKIDGDLMFASQLTSFFRLPKAE
jgi:putative sterol carrier protein